MGNCLITRLQSNVSDASLLKLGEMKFSFKSLGSSMPFKIQLSSYEGKVKIKTVDGKNGLGYNALSINSSELIIPTSLTNIFVANSDIELIIENKYDLRDFIFDSSSSEYVYIDFDALYFSRIVSLNIGGVKGRHVNLTRLSHSIGNLYLRYSDIDFNLELLNGMQNLKTLAIQDSSVTGDIAILGTLSALSIDESFNSFNNFIYGDIVEAVKNQTSCKSVLISTNKASHELPLVGDLAKLPASVKLINATGRNTNFTWSSRDSSSYAISLQGVNLENHVDTMLINQSNCILSEPLSVYDNVIDVRGSHDETSVSVSSAIAKIKNAGWKVKVNGITY